MRAARVGNDNGNLTDVVYFSMCSREYELQWTSGVAQSMARKLRLCRCG